MSDAPSERRTLDVYRLGRVAYADALALQDQLVLQRQAGEIGDTLLLLEHPPVVTLGRKARDGKNVLLTELMLRAKGIELFRIGRGGDATYHGPGQLVGYPIIDLTGARQDVRKYVSSLEETMIRICAEFGVEAGRVEGLNGTWVGDNKIGAVGVRIARWVTKHGFAINVTTDLSHFGVIVPCGIQDKGVTSLERELGSQVELDFEAITVKAAEHFAALHEAEVVWRRGDGLLEAHNIDHVV